MPGEYSGAASRDFGWACFTCFTGTKVHILTPAPMPNEKVPHLEIAAGEDHACSLGQDAVLRWEKKKAPSKKKVLLPHTVCVCVCVCERERER